MDLPQTSRSSFVKRSSGQMSHLNREEKQLSDALSVTGVSVSKTVQSREELDERSQQKRTFSVREFQGNLLSSSFQGLSASFVREVGRNRWRTHKLHVVNVGEKVSLRPFSAKTGTTF